MANPHRGELAFEAAGKTYTLQYSHDALVELEQELDRGIIGIINELQSWTKEPERIRLSWIRALLWAGLRKHHPDLDLLAAGELITDAGGIGEVVNLAGEGLGRAFSAPETKGARPRKRPNGTGIDSTSITSVSATTESGSGS
jgi:hypothetical protein